jgi:hypothetical protein
VIGHSEFSCFYSDTFSTTLSVRVCFWCFDSQFLNTLAQHELPVSHLITPHLYHQMRVHALTSTMSKKSSPLGHKWFTFLWCQMSPNDSNGSFKESTKRYDTKNKQSNDARYPFNPLRLRVTHQVISRTMRLLIWEEGRQGTYTRYWRTVWFGFNLVLYYWWWISLSDNLLRRSSRWTAFASIISITSLVWMGWTYSCL